MRPLLVFMLVASVRLLGQAAAAAQAPDLPSGVDKSLAVFAPFPKYPAEAKAQGLEGSGIVLMHVDRKTGRVTSVKIEKSTGHAILDKAAVEGFRRWRFKPGTVSTVHMPIAFNKTHTSMLSPPGLTNRCS
jgi:TonB family protein